MIKTSDFFSFEGCPCHDVFSEVQYPWDVLRLIENLIYDLVQKHPGKYRQIARGVWVGARTKVADTARFQGPALFGDDCDIRTGAYVRGNVLAGDHVVLGNSSEVKQAILFSEVQLPHFNYVGDSVLGKGAHLGAGAIISNFKSTKENVKVRIGQEIVETGLRKFGAILGDRVEVGCNAVLNPGTLIGRGSIVYPLSSVRGSIPPGMIYKGADQIVPYRPS
jgi:NDP-sugar pyrophosphorylase family protein